MYCKLSILGLFETTSAVLIVAKCIVNIDILPDDMLTDNVLIVAKCIVNSS